MSLRGKDREQFLLNAVHAGLPDHYARLVTRHAVTHDRLAEAECNGDWPCANGERKVHACSRCGSGYVRSTMIADRSKRVSLDECYPVNAQDGAMRGRNWFPLICKSCRTEDLISAICKENNVAVEFQGDPRGWTVKLSKAVQQ